MLINCSCVKIKIFIDALVSNLEFNTLCDDSIKGKGAPNGIPANIYDLSLWQGFNSDRYNNSLKTPRNLHLTLIDFSFLKE